VTVLSTRTRNQGEPTNGGVERILSNFFIHIREQREERENYPIVIHGEKLEPILFRRRKTPARHMYSLSAAGERYKQKEKIKEKGRNRIRYR
jgi:hypothetical protein